MKKRLFILAAVSVLTLCLVGAAAAEGYGEEAPDWKITASSEITPDARAAFDRAAAEMTDAAYEPVALLGVQGDVYCILCRAMVDLEDAEPYYTLVYVGENGVENVWDLWVESHSVPEKSEEDKPSPGCSRSDPVFVPVVGEGSQPVQYGSCFVFCQQRGSLPVFPLF